MRDLCEFDGVIGLYIEFDKRYSLAEHHSHEFIVTFLKERYSECTRYYPDTLSQKLGELRQRIISEKKNTTIATFYSEGISI